MNAHPKDKSERRKINAAKKRREALIEAALKKQEAEDAKRAQEAREHLNGTLDAAFHQRVGEQAEGNEAHRPM